jgi:MFS family permease
VPLFSFLVAGRAIARFGPGRVIAVGATVFAVGATWWALAAGTTPDYVGEMLGGMILTGIGVGLTLPTFMATGASSLPPAAFATGSAVVNMLRQVGLAVGVAVLVAVLGAPATPAAARTAFEHGWYVVAGASLLAALAGLLLLRPDPARRTVSAPRPEAA